MEIEYTIDEIRNIIDKADATYHNTGNTLVTDAMYDQCKQRLKKLDPADPRLTRVGSPVVGGGELTVVKHKMPMGSLSNVFNPTEFSEFAERVGKGAKFVASPKYDGFSLALYYDDGLLVKAVTRGDGVEGEDITHNAIRFEGVRSVLRDCAAAKGKVCIRGEVVLEYIDWYAVDPDSASNPRNLAVGIGRRKSGHKKQEAEHLSFYGFDYLSDSVSCETYEETMACLYDTGSQAIRYTALPTVAKVCEYYDCYTRIRSSLPFMVDGVVVRVNQNAVFEELGWVGRTPKGAVAWKFPPELKPSKIVNITNTVGRTGNITPVAEILPTVIGGVTVTNVSLSNWDKIKTLGVNVGDEVIVTREGDVIPGIVNVASKHSVGSYPPPTVCPACGQPATKLARLDGTEGVIYECTSEDCPAKIPLTIKRWAESIGIKGLGSELIDALTSTNPETGECLVKDVADLYAIVTDPSVAAEVSQLKVGNGEFGYVRLSKLVDELQKSRTMTAAKCIGSLGIKGLGVGRAEQVCKAAASCQQPNPLLSLPGWLYDGDKSFLLTHAVSLGIPKLAVPIVRCLDSLKDVILRLADVLTIEVPVTTDQTQAGKVICFSGIRPTEEQKVSFESAGGEIKGSVSKNTTHLVVKDASANTSKIVAAKAAGVSVITMDEFIGWIKS